MASVTPAFSTYHGTLTAATADTVTFLFNYRSVVVTNRGSTDIYVNTLGAAVVGASGTEIITAGSSAVIANAVPATSFGKADLPLVVSLISTGTPNYSLSAG